MILPISSIPNHFEWINNLLVKNCLEPLKLQTIEWQGGQWQDTAQHGPAIPPAGTVPHAVPQGRRCLWTWPGSDANRGIWMQNYGFAWDSTIFQYNVCVHMYIYIIYIKYIHNHQRKMTTNKNKYVILEYSWSDSPPIATVGQGSPCGKSSGVPAENRWATSGRALGAAPKGQACRSPGRPLNGTKASSSPDMSGSHGWPPSW